MTREEQTDAVKEQLYHLTLQFVRAYQPHYYKQFRGDLEDLAMEYYISFITPKSRVKGKEESLLDKFDPSVTNLPYLTKVAVTRKLIDSSRSDDTPIISINKYVDDYGDCITRAFLLSTEQEEDSNLSDIEEFSPEQVKTIKSKFLALSSQARQTVLDYFEEVKNVINPAYRSLIEKIAKEYLKPKKAVSVSSVSVKGYGECPVQQITDKTVCAYVPAFKQVINFTRLTGNGKGTPFRSLSLEEESMEMIKTVYKWHSGYSREAFESLYNSK